MSPWRALTYLCLFSLTASCADQSVITTTEYQQVYLPDRFLRECPVPQWGGGTYRQIGAHAKRIKTALENCNLQLQQGREYQDAIRSGQQLPDGVVPLK